MLCLFCCFFFFFNDTATTEIYTLSLHDALPICLLFRFPSRSSCHAGALCRSMRSEEHTSELQSRVDLVCRLLLEKKKKKKYYDNQPKSSNITKPNRRHTSAD